MGNSYFQFKQFTITQQHSAMKVTTDACLFGAVLADAFKSKEDAGRILDAGAGTGLLSLMMAQKINAQIDAVEIDGAAAAEAKNNFAQSPWPGRLHLIHCDINQLEAEAGAYDIILSNPPFYEKDLHSPDQQKNAAMHDTHLTLATLVKKLAPLLSVAGTLALLLPFSRMQDVLEIIKPNGLQVSKKIIIKHNAAQQPIRCILFFNKKENKIIEEEILLIREADDAYTSRFMELLKGYYLYL